MKKILVIFVVFFLAYGTFAEKYEGKVFIIINEVDAGKILVKKENKEIVVANEWKNSVKTYGQNKVILEQAAERDRRLKDNQFHITSDIDALAMKWLEDEE